MSAITPKPENLVSLVLRSQIVTSNEPRAVMRSQIVTSSPGARSLRSQFVILKTGSYSPDI